MIKYHLVENHLTKRADDYMAQVHASSAFDKNALVERMLQRGSLLTKTDIVAVLNGLEETVGDIIKEGGTITMPLFHTSFSISGVFNGVTDSFDPLRHAVNINISKGTFLRNLQPEVSTEKTATPAPTNTIAEVKDSVTGEVNGKVTNGGVLEIFGSNIKICGDKPANGVYFISADGTETKVVTLVQNNPSNLIALVPVLEEGTYTLKVVTQFTGSSNFLKEPRTANFAHTLTISS